MSEKKKTFQIQEFQPKDLKRIIQTIPEKPGVHPTLDDLAKMAQDTIENAPDYIHDEEKLKKVIKDAKETQIDIEKTKKRKA